MGNILKAFFGNYSKRELKRIQPLCDKVLALEEKYKALSDEDLQAQTPALKERLANGETLDDILPDAFAVCREASARVLQMRHFPVQIIGGIVLHQGRIAEMKTGEGKTLGGDAPRVFERAWQARASTSSPSTTIWPAATPNGWASCTASLDCRSA